MSGTPNKSKRRLTGPLSDSLQITELSPEQIEGKPRLLYFIHYSLPKKIVYTFVEPSTQD